MSTALQQFEETYDLINEIITPRAPASGAIAATNDSPRKDFGPSSTSSSGYPPSSKNKGMLDPYQSHPLSTMPDAERPAHLPYPLDTINDFLAQACVYLDGAISQMNSAGRNNPVLSPVFKSELKRLTAINKNALKAISYVGKNLTKVANLNY